MVLKILARYCSPPLPILASSCVEAVLCAWPTSMLTIIAAPALPATCAHSAVCGDQNSAQEGRGTRVRTRS
jgi:hypothetical protein